MVRDVIGRESQASEYVTSASGNRIVVVALTRAQWLLGPLHAQCLSINVSQSAKPSDRVHRRRPVSLRLHTRHGSASGRVSGLASAAADGAMSCCSSDAAPSSG